MTPTTRALFGLLGGALLLVACPGSGLKPGLPGDSCASEDDCARELVCAKDATCRVEGDLGTGGPGDECVTGAQCRLGYACNSSGQCAEEGTSGTAGVGDTCADDADCAFGLQCGEAGTCYGFELPLWFGADCPDPEADDGPFRVYFEVPGDEPLSEFYRLPFPNDARVAADGTLDLSGHPSPGALIPELGDVVGHALEVASEDLGAFGNNQTVFFRFSAEPDFGSISLGLPGAGGNLALVDVTPGLENRPAFQATRYRASTGRQAYICHNWMSLTPLDGRALLPGHTYAALVGRNITREGSGTLNADADFEVMLGSTAPADARLARAWEAYAPLRAWLLESGTPTSALAAAAVFTVQDVEADPEALRAAIDAADVPELSGAILCGDDADIYAVAGDDTRGCASPAGAAYSEIQALVGLPQFQAGTPPFKEPSDGGAIDFSGTPTPVRTEQVHITLTVPDGDMPADGWPVVIYGHGTGGSYTSAVREGLAADLSAVDLGAGTVIRFATVGFDAPLHGPRAAPQNWRASWLTLDPNAYDPDVLFFNPINMRALRDNPLQQAADTWSVTRLVADLDLAADASPTGARVTFDTDRIYYLGHSQGAVMGTLYAAYDPDVDTVVLSGGGGLTIEALLAKTSPNDISAMIKVGLADPDTTRQHPLLNLAQAISERADGVNHARRLFDPPAPLAPKDVFMIWGVGDTYSPDGTQLALARAFDLPQVSVGVSDTEGLDVGATPISGNRRGRTAVVGRYAPTVNDAHFVLFDRADARTAMARFFATAARDGVPTFP